MPAVQETVAQVRALDVDKYKYGFDDRHRIRPRAEGAERGYRPLHFGQEERAAVDARLAARRLQALAGHGRADLGAGALSEDRLPGHLLLRRAEEATRSKASTRSIRSCSRSTRSSASR